MMRKFSSLRTRLLALLSLAALPIVVLVIIQTLFDIAEDRTREKQQILYDAEAALDTAQRTLSDTNLLLRANAVALKRRNGCSRLLEDFQKQVSVVTNIGVANADGIVTCSALGAIGTPIPDMKWLEPFRRGEEAVVTNAFYGPHSETMLFAVLSRIEDDEGKFAGISIAGIDAHALIELLENDFTVEGMRAALIDEDGNVFGYEGFESLPDPNLVGLARDRELMTIRINGEPYNVAVSALGPNNISTLIAKPQRGAVATLTSRPVRSVALPLLALIAAGLAIWWSIDVLVLRWLSRVSRVVAIYSGGRYSLRDEETINHAPEEIAELAAGLKRMAETIAQREHSLEQALEVRDGAIKEVHHRVKNNLQIVSSFLSLEARATQSPEAKDVLSKARSRITALSIVHQTLYQYERLEEVEIRPFLQVLLDHLDEALGIAELRIDLRHELDDSLIASDDAIPIALAVLELVTNSVKYAFQGRSGGVVNVSFKALDEQFELAVSDDGIGMLEVSEGGSGLGSKLLTAFTRQLKGELSVDIENGRTTTITFPKKPSPLADKFSPKP